MTHALSVGVRILSGVIVALTLIITTPTSTWNARDVGVSMIQYSSQPIRSITETNEGTNLGEEDMHKDQLRGLIEETLSEVKLYSEDATELLMGTAAVESNLGYYIKQVGGPARGIFQMEPDTERDIWENYLRFKSNLSDTMVDLGYYGPDAAKLVYDLRYQVLMARIHYLRVSDAIPPSLVGKAIYWKDHYNTRRGKGTVEKFMEKYKEYVICRTL